MAGMPRQDTDPRSTVIERLIRSWTTRAIRPPRGTVGGQSPAAQSDLPQDDIERMLGHGDEVLQQSLHDPEEAVIRLLEAYLEVFRTSADQEALLSQLNRGCVHGVTGEPRVRAQMTTLLRRYQAQSIIDSELPIDDVTVVLHSLLMTILLSLVCSDNGPPHSVHRCVADCVQTLFRNWLTW